MNAGGLSDKAKGKQRASEYGDTTEPGASVLQPKPALKTLVIRFSEGISDLDLEVTELDAVRDIKCRIREYRPQLRDHRLRLIHSGRLLTDSTLLYSWLASLEEKQWRASSAAVGDIRDASQSTTWVHCSVGQKMEPGEEDETKIQQTQLKPLRGFDRLAAAGFTAEDIANIRSQFHSQSARDFLDQDFTTDEDFDERARSLEEQWIDSMDSVGSASLSQGPSETPNMILNGIILGFFFPILPFFFFHENKRAVFWEEGPDHDVVERSPLSKRIQMGIAIGLIMNLVFGIWTYALSG